MDDYKSDIGIELKMISIDSGVSLDQLALHYWSLMWESQHIEDPKAREILVINCMANNYLNS